MSYFVNDRGIMNHGIESQSEHKRKERDSDDAVTAMDESGKITDDTSGFLHISNNSIRIRSNNGIRTKQGSL